MSNGDLALTSGVPTAKLDLTHTATNSDPSAIFRESSTDFNRIRISNGNSNVQYWDLLAKSATGADSEKDFRFRYRNNSVTHDVLTISGIDKRVGINTTNPGETLRVEGESGVDALRVRLDGTTKLMVHDNGAVSIGSASKPEEDDTSLEIDDHMRIKPQSSETCANSGDVGKIYFDSDADKLRVCVADYDGPVLPGTFGWVNLH
jgi:hypothetical protein